MLLRSVGVHRTLNGGVLTMNRHWPALKVINGWTDMVVVARACGRVKVELVMLLKLPSVDCHYLTSAHRHIQPHQKRDFGKLAFPRRAKRTYQTCRIHSNHDNNDDHDNSTWRTKNQRRRSSARASGRYRTTPRRPASTILLRTSASPRRYVVAGDRRLGRTKSRLGDLWKSSHSLRRLPDVADSSHDRWT